MSGLVISLRPDERFLVNGALLKNGPKRSQIYVEDDNVYVLRLTDALHPDEINTPMKRVYFCVQTILSGDVSPEDGTELVLKGLSDLAAVFKDTPLEEKLNRASKSAKNKRFYSVLYTLKPMFEIEARLLEIQDEKVALHPSILRAYSEMAHAG